MPPCINPSTLQLHQSGAHMRGTRAIALRLSWFNIAFKISWKFQEPHNPDLHTTWYFQFIPWTQHSLPFRPLLNHLLSTANMFRFLIDVFLPTSRSPSCSSWFHTKVVQSSIFPIFMQLTSINLHFQSFLRVPAFFVLISSHSQTLINVDLSRHRTRTRRWQAGQTPVLQTTPRYSIPSHTSSFISFLSILYTQSRIDPCPQAVQYSQQLMHSLLNSIFSQSIFLHSC